MARDPESNAGSATLQPYPWKFVRLGGFDQVRILSGADMLALDRLDQKLWTALGCPTHGLQFDERTLQRIDSDGDGRIRVPELIAAVHWAGKLLKNPDALLDGSSGLPLSAIDDTSEEGQRILKSARQILANLGKPDAPVITAEDTADTARIFADTRFNGDGVICPESAVDEETAALLREIMDCMGSDMDRSGRPGVGEEKLNAFFAAADAYVGWWRLAEEDTTRLLPFGEKTDAAAATFQAVKAKIDDYFLRCRLAAYDPRAADHLSPPAEEYQSLSSRDLSSVPDQIAALPLARIEPNGSLPLSEGINPAWAAALEGLRTEVLTPLLGEKATLGLEDWQTVSAAFAAMEAWRSAKKGEAVEKLGIARVREIVSGPYRDVVYDLLAKDKALQAEADAIDAGDRLVRYHRDLYTLVRNFVSFTDFYNPKAHAIFQAGTLYLDQRSCALCVRVDDVESHSALAGLSRTYLAYCACKRRGGQETMHIAAAFTDGDSDNLRVGRNGIFYDRQGRDWDATIVKILEHPISVRQAFWAPYKRFARMVAEQIEKFAASKEKAVDAKAAVSVTAAATAPVPPPSAAAPPPPTAVPFDIGKFAGIFAAIGLAVGAIGTALASVLTGLMSLHWWQIPLALAGLLLIISGPSMILAWLKLRQRNLAPILDACGWAVNARAKINIPFGMTLTAVASLPEGARRTTEDPFAEKSGLWKLWVLLIAAAAAALIWWNKDFFLPKPAGEKAKPAVTSSAEPSHKPAETGAPPAPAPKTQ
uniref:EF-hand domain-containing protein n=1 Tax=Desulfacinum infernum TaxID=35837 RepID=A0A831ZYE5_9BACT